jgi:mono/diheme cytochrome c family protein
MKKEILVFLFMTVLAATGGCGLRGSEAIRGGDMEGMTMSRSSVPASRPSSPVRSISLPHDEAFAPPGPGRAAFVTDCVVCHSPRYITDQPSFSRTVWKGIVQKMMDAYGAHVTTAEAEEIVNYLVATDGAHMVGGEDE